MKVKQLFLSKFSIYLILLSIPLSYFVFYGVRVLPFLISLSVVIILIKSQKIIFDISLIPIILIIFWILIMSLLINDFLSLFSILIFFFIMYWPLFLEEKYISIKNLDNFIKVYIFMGVFMGVGVIIQSFLFNSFGVVIGKMDEMYERVGFGFIWSDYSFFSLYLASIVPLVWYKNKFPYSVVLSIFFIFSSIVTTARTGFFGVIIFLILYILYIFLKNIFLIGRVNLKKIFLGLIFLGLGIGLGLPVMTNSFGRIFDLDSSGRFEGYLVGLSYFFNNIIFGSYYSVDFYKNNVGVVPHNLFFYNLILGGGILFILFTFWFLIVLQKTLSTKNKYISYSILISIIGFQFIPAVFTAYFFAFLLSLMFYTKRIDNLNMRNFI